MYIYAYVCICICMYMHVYVFICMYNVNLPITAARCTSGVFSTSDKACETGCAKEYSPARGPPQHAVLPSTGVPRPAHSRGPLHCMYVCTDNLSPPRSTQQDAQAAFFSTSDKALSTPRCLQGLLRPQDSRGQFCITLVSLPL